MSATITLRPAHSDDEAFLCQVYASTRQEELAMAPWDDAAKERFCQMQFDAQTASYRERFPDAAFDIILADDLPVGRFYVDRRDDEFRIIDIALLPEHRNAGIGRMLVSELLVEAGRADKPVRIHVERYNPAMRLYERLGFTRVGDAGVYLLMEWSAHTAEP